MSVTEKYKQRAVLIFSALFIVLVLLFVTIWNNISLSQEIALKNSVYILLVLALLLVAALFALSIWYANTVSIGQDMLFREVPAEGKEQKTTKQNPYTAPSEADIDLLADKILAHTNRSLPLSDYTEQILINLARELEISQALLYLKNEQNQHYEIISTYAYTGEIPEPFSDGEGLSGQAAKSKKIMVLDNIPENYLNIVSGLGEHKPRTLIIIPLLLNKEAIGVMELSSFQVLDDEKTWIIKNLVKIIGNVIVNKIKSGKPKR